MKRSKVLIVLLLLIGLGSLAFYLASREDDASKLSDEALSDFAIDDTASVDKLILSDTEGNAGITLVKNGNEWTAENGDCIQQHLVQNILDVIRLVRVKAPVPKSTIETVNKNLTTHHKKVQIYTNGELAKTWFVGQPTPDQYGTYMLLKDPEKGKSPEPFIMYLPNVHGNLEPRFITDPKKFECTGVFNYSNPLTIKSIDVQIPDSSQYNFKIELLGDNEFKLTSNGQNIEKFDTSNVRNYILGYKKIHFEQHNYLIDQEAADSVKQTTPWFIIEVTDVEGEKNKVKLYRKHMIYEKYDFEGNLIEFDRDRLWVLLDDGRLVIGQFYVFDKLMVDLRIFVADQGI